MVKTLQLIRDDAERQKAFLRTKTNLLKKSRELSVLCDVKLGVFIDYPPEYPLMIWPPDNTRLILSLIDSYKKLAGQSTLINNSQHCDSNKVMIDENEKATKQHTESVELDGTLEKKIEQTWSRLQCIKEGRNYPVDSANHLFQSKSSIVSWDQPMMNPPTPKYDGAGFNFQEVPAATYNYNSYDHGNMGVVPLLTQGEIANNSHAVHGQPLQEIDQTCLVQKNRNLQETKTSQLCGPAMRQPTQVVSTFAQLMSTSQYSREKQEKL